MPAEELPDLLGHCQWTDWGTLLHEAALGCGVGWREWVVAFSPPWEAPFFAYDCGRAGEAMEGKVNFEGFLGGADGFEVEEVARESGQGWQVSGEDMLCMGFHDWQPGAPGDKFGSWGNGQNEFDCGMDMGRGFQTLSD